MQTFRTQQVVYFSTFEGEDPLHLWVLLAQEPHTPLVCPMAHPFSMHLLSSCYVPGAGGQAWRLGVAD